VLLHCWVPKGLGIPGNGDLTGPIPERNEAESALFPQKTSAGCDKRKNREIFLRNKIAAPVSDPLNFSSS
jgi:hypothetical protein